MRQVEGFSHRITIIQGPDRHRLRRPPIPGIAMGKGQGVLITARPRIRIHFNRRTIAIGHRNGDIRPRIGIQHQRVALRNFRRRPQLGQGQGC